MLTSPRCFLAWTTRQATAVIILLSDRTICIEHRSDEQFVRWWIILLCDTTAHTACVRWPSIIVHRTVRWRCTTNSFSFVLIAVRWSRIDPTFRLCTTSTSVQWTLANCTVWRSRHRTCEMTSGPSNSKNVWSYWSIITALRVTSSVFIMFRSSPACTSRLR